ncbi:MAG: QsdR family transcriptional regulator [Moraxellaceae bacterium]|nr:QsdR family transcriptional regulator [Moraxellaceae bacterium]MDZ4386302.1 QsdR family transcriptional regulator [Moraxellaceae bacterium]
MNRISAASSKPTQDVLTVQRRGRACAADALELGRRRFLAGERIEMQALAAELGVNRATLYRWWGREEQLMGEVLWSFAQNTLLRARARHAAEPDRLQALVLILQDYMHAVHHSSALHQFIAADPESALRILASKHSPVQSRTVEAIEALLQAETSIHQRLPTDLAALAYAIVRIGESFAYTDVIANGSPDPVMAMRLIKAILLAPWDEV